MADEKLYTVEEAAKKLGIHKMTLYTQVRKGQFKGAVNVEKDDNLRPKWRIPESALHKGLVTQERRNAVREKRAPEEVLMPDSDTKRKLIQRIKETFPVHPLDTEARYENHFITIFGQKLAYGPDMAYLGAHCRAGGYVIEIDIDGQVTSIHQTGKHSVDPIATESAMLAWQKDAIEWQSKYERLATRVIASLAEDSPEVAQLEQDIYLIRSRRARARMIGEVIWEVVSC